METPKKIKLYNESFGFSITVEYADRTIAYAERNVSERAEFSRLTALYLGKIEWPKRGKEIVIIPQI